MTEQNARPYQQQSPWHRLGTDISQAATVAEALQLAQLDWTVSLHDLYWEKQSEAHYLGEVKAELIHVPQRKVVIRDTDRKILGTVGNTYVPLQNHEAFSVLEVAIQEFGVKLVAGGTYGTSLRSWLLARLPDDATIVEGDTVCPYFLVSTGHDGATPYVAVPTPFRIACANALDVAVGHGYREMLVRLTHTKDAAKKLDTVSDMVESVLTSFKRLTLLFQGLAKHQVPMGDLHDYIDAVLGIEEGDAVKGVLERRRAELRRLITEGKGNDLAPRTAWAAYNAVTEYVDHVRPAEATAKTVQTANEQALFGRNALLKHRALVLAKGLV
jgi:phage/plasmid-like protein (TIGR03299 family)